MQVVDRSLDIPVAVCPQTQAPFEALDRHFNFISSHSVSAISFALRDSSLDTMDTRLPSLFLRLNTLHQPGYFHPAGHRDEMRAACRPCAGRQFHVAALKL